MIRWFTFARSLVFLRRIANAEERSATALETLARIATDQWARKRARSPGKTEISFLDTAEAEKLYNQRRIENFEINESGEEL